MNKHFAIAAFVSSLLVTFPNLAKAAKSCDGNASQVVDVTWVQVTATGGHFDTTNQDPTRTVYVTFDLISGGSMGLTLSPSQTDYPGAGPYYPLQTYKTPCHANYK